jgi:hypothetical protein
MGTVPKIDENTPLSNHEHPLIRTKESAPPGIKIAKNISPNAIIMLTTSIFTPI